MRIIFLNTWGGKCKEGLSSFLKEQATRTDAFCFQEFWDDMPALSREVLTDFVEIDFQKQPMHEAIYVRKNMSISAAVPILKKDALKGSGGYVCVRHGDNDLYICNVHGWPYPGDKRDDEHRLKQSAEVVASLKEKSGLKIIGGDFNLLPETESVRMFAENDYRNLIEEFNIQTTRNRLAWDKYPSKQFFADYVFTSPDVKVRDFSVPALEISDHLPLIVEID